MNAGRPWQKFDGVYDGYTRFYKLRVGGGRTVYWYDWSAIEFVYARRDDIVLINIMAREEELCGSTK